MPIRKPFEVVVKHVSNDTADALASLHEQARSGKVIGIAFVAMYNGRFFVTGSTGECDRNPVWALGMVDILRARLRRDAEGDLEQG